MGGRKFYNIILEMELNFFKNGKEKNFQPEKFKSDRKPREQVSEHSKILYSFNKQIFSMQSKYVKRKKKKDWDVTKFGTNI